MADRPTLHERRLSRVRFSMQDDDAQPAAPLAIDTAPAGERRGIDLPEPTPFHMLARSMEVDPMDAFGQQQATPAPPDNWAESYRGFAQAVSAPATQPDMSPRSTVADEYEAPVVPRPIQDVSPRTVVPEPYASHHHHRPAPIHPPAPAHHHDRDRSGTPTVMVTPMSPPQQHLRNGVASPVRAHAHEPQCMCQSPDPAAKRVSTSSASSGNTSPLKPALRRTRTEDVLAREAAELVSTHTHRPPPPDPARLGAHPCPASTQRDVFVDVDQEHGQPARTGNGTGVLSNLLQLYGRDASGLRHRSVSQSSAGTSVAQSRSPSNESSWSVGGPADTRRHSNDSLGSTLVGDGPEPTSPSKKPGFRRRSSAASDDASIKSTGSAWARLRRGSFVDWNAKKAAEKSDGKGRRRRASITRHVADILLRQDFILKLAKALMTFGAPSHRIESQLSSVASVLDVDAQFVHLPSVVIASFGDHDTHTTETHFVKSPGGLDLGSLTLVHEIFRRVVHDEIGVQDGSAQLTEILRAKPIYTDLQRILIAFLCAGIIAPLGFAGSFVDGWVSAFFGALLAFLQLRVATKNAMYSNIFEISIATIVSFVARGLSTTNIFCYEAISSAGVVLVLPGYVILCGSLELASRNLVAGSVKLVYAIIYSLFLGFGISIGSELYMLFDPRARTLDDTPSIATFSVTGTLVTSNGTVPTMQGVFTFTNNSMASMYDPTAALRQGSVSCYRDPSWEWYRQTVNPYWMILLVPAFSAVLSLWNLQPIRNRNFPVMVIISCVGYTANYFANLYIFNRSDVVSFIGAFTIGVLGNLYSRIFRGTAFTAMVTGVLFLVPSGIAAAGGLAMTYKSDGDSYSNGLIIGFVVYSIGGKRKRTALFGF